MIEWRSVALVEAVAKRARCRGSDWRCVRSADGRQRLAQSPEEMFPDFYISG